VFPVYAVPIGLVAGWLLGGRLEGLAELRFRWAWLAIAGLVAQIVLFSGAVDEVVRDILPAAYVGSTVAVLAAVLRNVRIPGLVLVAVGALSNLAAILANGGYMPSTRAAYAIAGIEPDESLSNSVLLADPALWPLTDIFALPDALPFANVFSVGDVLIGLGLALTIALAMRRGGKAASVGGTAEAGDEGERGPVRVRTSPD
jgi:hypothetical protein